MDRREILHRETILNEAIAFVSFSSRGYPFPLDDTPLLQRTVPLKVRYMEYDSIREARFGVKVPPRLPVCFASFVFNDVFKTACITILSGV